MFIIYVDSENITCITVSLPR